jgi:hypothetical protein
MATQQKVTTHQRRRQIRKIVAQCRAAKIQLVRFLYCGKDGGSWTPTSNPASG